MNENEERNFDLVNALKPKTLGELIKELYRIFDSNQFDETKRRYTIKVLENYESKPEEWIKYVKYDPAM